MSETHFGRSALKQLLRIPAAKAPAEFSAIFLFAAGEVNTPAESLVEDVGYDCSFLLLAPGVFYDAVDLRRRADVVVNLVSDVDQGAGILQLAETVTDDLFLPVVNHPRKIRKTGRENVSALLSAIPGCHVPRACRFTASAMPSLDAPMLLRVAGRHGGMDLERTNDRASAEHFIARYPAENYYATDYVDTQSHDGFYRKYRFFFVDAQILPYHLAIGSSWKVHHATTDMANQPWMQQEEAAFLSEPAGVFDPRHFVALDSIRRIMGLEFCGIDFALGRDGRLVVFEVNATMRVHTDFTTFPYKAPAVQRIKLAFDAMLRRMALQVKFPGAGGSTDGAHGAV